jgi:hypothetical protein
MGESQKLKVLDLLFSTGAIFILMALNIFLIGVENQVSQWIWTPQNLIGELQNDGKTACTVVF